MSPGAADRLGADRLGAVAAQLALLALDEDLDRVRGGHGAAVSASTPGGASVVALSSWLRGLAAG